MKKAIDLVMFDLDGTLAATGRDLATSVNHVRSRFQLRPLEDQHVYRHVGRGVEHLIRNALPNNYQDRFQEIMDVFLDHYESHLLDTTALYPGVREILEYFGDKRRVVVSNKLHRLTVAVVRGLGIQDCFDAILGGDSSPRKKPDPDALNQVLAKFRVAPRKALMIGDGEADIEAGKKAGVMTCGVTYGLGSKQELIAAKPDVVVDHLEQLTDYYC